MHYCPYHLGFVNVCGACLESFKYEEQIAGMDDE